MQLGKSYLQVLFTIFTRFNQFPDLSVSIGRHIEWEIAKHLLAQMERLIPFGIFRSAFCIFYMLANEMGLPLNGKKPKIAWSGN